VSEPSISKLAQLAGGRLIGSPTLCGIINQPMMVALRAAGAEQPIAEVSDMSLRLCFVGAGLGLTRVPTSIAELSVGKLTRAGISYRPLEPPVHVDLMIARLKSARAEAALERFVEAARGACQAHDSKRAVSAGAR
jgi:DNA-binding transcriptional LysR family regulator